MRLECKECGRKINAPISALIDGSTCSKCSGDFKKVKGEPIEIPKIIFPKHLMLYIISIGLIIFLLIAAFDAFYVVNAGERGVLLTFGKPNMEAVNEGLHFKWPIAQKVNVMDVRTKKYESAASSASKDLQIVSTNIAVNYHLVPSLVPLMYQEIGIAYEEKVIQPTVQEVVKATIAEFTAEELITKRPAVKDSIKLLLIERLSSRNLIVEEVSITNFDFSASFNSAIEAKVTAEQQKLKADRDLQRIEVEAEQKIAQARAEAESLRLQAEQLKQSKDILELRWIEKWDGKLPQVTGGAVPFMNVNEFTNT